MKAPEKKTVRFEAVIYLPHSSDLRNVFALSTIPELFRYEPKGLCRAAPMQCACFYLFPLSFTSAYCAVPSRAYPIQCAPSLILACNVILADPEYFSVPDGLPTYPL
jgi:hypothetical protein